MNSKYILCIDTSVQTASVALSKDSKHIALKSCLQQRDHGAFLQPAIQQLLQEQQITISQLSAIAVTAGPGSYTGLRVGMASAKGLCYALNIPLITISSLEVMAHAALQDLHNENSFLLCPMIDARRMEVFTAVYSSALQLLRPPHALILSENSFDEHLDKNTVFFFGNGSGKWAALCKHPNARFIEVEWNAASMTDRVWELYNHQQFASLAYATPFYGKEFYSPSKI